MSCFHFKNKNAMNSSDVVAHAYSPSNEKHAKLKNPDFEVSLGYT